MVVQLRLFCALGVVLRVVPLQSMHLTITTRPVLALVFRLCYSLSLTAIAAAPTRILLLQDRNNELREEVRWHEAQQLNSTAFAAEPKAKRKPQCSTVQ